MVPSQVLLTLASELWSMYETTLRRLAGRTRLRASMLGLSLTAVALLAAACGGSSGAASSGKSSSKATSSKSSGSSSSDSAFLACLKKHGVNISNIGHRPSGGYSSGGSGTYPSSSSGGFGSATSSAFAACAKYRPNRARGFGGSSSSSFGAYRTCLEKHGVKLPSGGSGTPGANPFSDSSSTLKKAMAACAGLRPSFGGFGSQPSSSSGSSGAT